MNLTGTINVGVVEGPSLQELIEAGIERTICVFKLSNDIWLEGFADKIQHDKDETIVLLHNVLDGRRYSILYNARTRKGRIMDILK